MIARMLHNWQTSIVGIGMIMTALGDFFDQLGHGTWDMSRLQADAIGLFGGVGLLLARDASASARHEERTERLEEKH